MKIQDLIIVAAAVGFLWVRREVETAHRLLRDWDKDIQYDIEISESEVQDIYEEQGIPWSSDPRHASGGALTSTVPTGDYARSDYLA